MPVLIELLAQRVALALLDVAIDSLKKLLNDDETEAKNKP